MRLIERVALQLDSTIGEFLNLGANIDSAITIRQLLNHTSGIPDYFDESIMDEYAELWIDVPNYRIRSSWDLVPLFSGKPMMYPRGERFQYNNTGYVVLGLIIERITGIPFDQHLHEVIFEPCNMANTGYYELDRLPKNCANERNNVIHDYLLKSCRYIVEFCKAHDIGNIVLGFNENMTRDLDLGRSNNQNLAVLPMGKIKRILGYMCQDANISFFPQEESYTSKASFWDNDPIEKCNYSGKR